MTKPEAKAIQESCCRALQKLSQHQRKNLMIDPEYQDEAIEAVQDEIERVRAMANAELG